MRKVLLVFLLANLAMAGCASVEIKPVDYSWSFESVLTADATGQVKAEPKTFAFNAGELFRAETKAPGSAAGKIVRIIRDRDGYYFMTSPGFKHVYIFAGEVGAMTLHKKVLIAADGMEKPFFNRRDRGIELVANGLVYQLNKKGFVPGAAR